MTITKIAIQWFDMQHAPVDRIVVTRSKCNKAIISHWIADKERWNMYTKNEPPIGWFPIPAIEKPKKEKESTDAQ